MADFQTQRADGVVDDLRRIRSEEDQVVVLCASALEDARYGSVVQELHDRRLQAIPPLRAFIDLDVGETFRAITRNVRRVFIDLRARHGAARRNAQCGHASLRILGRTCKHF